MAEINLKAVANSGVDPITGSPLSKEVRQAILTSGSSNISSTVFKGETFISQYASNRQADLQFAQTNQQALVTLDAQIKGLNSQILSLNSGLQNIVSAIEQDSLSDRSRIEAQAERDRRYAEQEVRIGKESEIEQKIQSVVSEPAQKIAPKVSNIFERVQRALLFLFGGWLTNQLVQAFEAKESGDRDKLNQIKNNIIKHSAAALGILYVLSGGFVQILRVLGSVVARIGGLIGKIVTAPIRAVGTGIKSIASAAAGAVGLGGVKSTTPVKPGVKPTTPPRGPGLIGGLNSAFGVGMNLKSGENVDAAVNAAGFLPGLPGVAARGLGFVDDITEVFLPGFRGGAGILGNTPRGGEKSKDVEAAKVSPQTIKAGPPKPAPTPAVPAPAETPAPATPATPAVPAPAETPAPATPESPVQPAAQLVPAAPAIDVSSQIASPLDKETYPQPFLSTNTSPSPTAPIVTPTESKINSQTPNLSLASTKPEVSSKPQTSMTPGMTNLVKFDFNQSDPAYTRIEESFDQKQSEQQPEIKPEEKKENGQNIPEVASPTQSNEKNLNIEPNQVQSVPKPLPNVGSLPDPKPTVVAMPSQQSSSPAPQQSPASSNESATDVPLINSGNPDNFYTLYSQLNYNVVT